MSFVVNNNSGSDSISFHGVVSPIGGKGGVLSHGVNTIGAQGGLSPVELYARGAEVIGNPFRQGQIFQI